MGERKVINKYYPPDFDPSILPKKAKPKNDQLKVRLMLPMTICCSTCNEYIYKGKKFNARKETVDGENYLGIRIFRFYIKCTKCSSEITFKTDPKNSDYRTEFGATRNYEPWKEEEEVNAQNEEKKKEEESDAFAKLESRTKKLRKEMETMDKLDELRTLNTRNISVDVNQVLYSTQRKSEEELKKKMEEEDEEELRSVVFLSSTNHHLTKNLNQSKNNDADDAVSDPDHDRGDDKKIKNLNDDQTNTQNDDAAVDGEEKIIEIVNFADDHLSAISSSSSLRPKLAIKKKKKTNTLLPSFITVQK